MNSVPITENSTKIKDWQLGGLECKGRKYKGKGRWAYSQLHDPRVTVTLALTSHSLEKESHLSLAWEWQLSVRPHRGREQTASLRVFWSCCWPELKSKLMFHPSQLRPCSSLPLPPSKSGSCSSEPPRASYLTVTT